MRVMAGEARGVPLQLVPDMNTRPILDRVKKSLFSVLDAAGLLVDARVADFYSGTGTQGIEALSRGAEYCLFVEKRPDAGKLLKENLAKTKLSSRAEVVIAFVSGEITRRKMRIQSDPAQRFDLILYDPPFSFVREDAQRAAAEAELSAAGELLFPGHARLVLRLETKVDPPKPSGLEMVRHWKGWASRVCVLQACMISGAERGLPGATEQAVCLLRAAARSSGISPI